jgi:hypothetical protein
MSFYRKNSLPEKFSTISPKYLPFRQNAAKSDMSMSNDEAHHPLAEA